MDFSALFLVHKSCKKTKFLSGTKIEYFEQKIFLQRRLCRVSLSSFQNVTTLTENDF